MLWLIRLSLWNGCRIFEAITLVYKTAWRKIPDNIAIIHLITASIMVTVSNSTATIETSPSSNKWQPVSGIQVINISVSSGMDWIKIEWNLFNEREQIWEKNAKKKNCRSSLWGHSYSKWTLDNFLSAPFNSFWRMPLLMRPRGSHPIATNEGTHLFPLRCVKIIACWMFAYLISSREELQLPPVPQQLDRRHNDTRERDKIIETASSHSWSGRVPSRFICIILGLREML